MFGHHARAAVALGGAHAFKVPGFMIEAEGWQVNGKTALSCEFSKRGIGNLGDEIDTRVVKAWCRVVRCSSRFSVLTRPNLYHHD